MALLSVGELDSTHKFCRGSLGYAYFPGNTHLQKSVFPHVFRYMSARFLGGFRGPEETKTGGTIFGYYSMMNPVVINYPFQVSTFGFYSYALDATMEDNVVEYNITQTIGSYAEA